MGNSEPWRTGDPPPDPEHRAALEREALELLGEWRARGYVRLGPLGLEWLHPQLCEEPETWCENAAAWATRIMREALERERHELAPIVAAPVAVEPPAVLGQHSRGLADRMRRAAAEGRSLRALLLAATREPTSDLAERLELARLATAIRDGSHCYGLRRLRARALAEGWHALLDNDGPEAAARAVGGC